MYDINFQVFLHLSNFLVLSREISGLDGAKYQSSMQNVVRRILNRELTEVYNTPGIAENMNIRKEITQIQEMQLDYFIKVLNLHEWELAI